MHTIKFPRTPSNVLLDLFDNLVLPSEIPQIAAAVSPKNRQFNANKHYYVSKNRKLNPKPRKKLDIPVLLFISEGRIREPKYLQYRLLNGLKCSLNVSKMKMVPESIIKIAPARLTVSSESLPIKTLAIEPQR